MTTKSCRRSSMGGSLCELAEGHDGEHQSTSYPYGHDKPPFVFNWTDEGQRKLIQKYGSRFD